ncbi:hypothetical protein P692DRAFT_201800744 [Suillus brevipes Sb2]|nr:hypothetical protein P692DRAFT_201800744 [Suillus brevipes Sb2]
MCLVLKGTVEYQRLDQEILVMEAYRSKDQWFVPYVTAMDLRHCTSDRIAREECAANDEGDVSAFNLEAQARTHWMGACVIRAGNSTRLSTPPKLSASVNSFSFGRSALALLAPPLTRNETILP